MTVPDTTILPFPPPTEAEVRRLWQAFQDAVAHCDEAVLDAQAAGERFRQAFLAWGRGHD